VGGATSGATASALSGGNIGRGSLAGAVGAGFGYIGPVGALVGGGFAAEIAGGNFLDGVAGAGAFLAGTYIGQQLPGGFNLIARSLSTLRSTNWSTTDRGEQIVGTLGTYQWRGKIGLRDLPHNAEYNDTTDLITVNSKLDPLKVSGRLAHEGAHVVQDMEGQVYGFASEREAYDIGYAVDTELHVPGASNPTDLWIRITYAPYFE